MGAHSMKRPFAVVGITYLIAQTVAVLCGMAATVALFCVTVLGALVLFIFLKERPVWVMASVLSCAVCLAFNGAYMFFCAEPARAIEGQTVMLSGEICRPPVSYEDRFHYFIDTDSIWLEGAPSSVCIRLSSSNPLEVEYGDHIFAEVRILHSDKNSYTTRRLLAEGVMLTGVLSYGSEVRITKGEPSLYRGIIRLRESFCTESVLLFDDELGGLLIGMVTGDTSRMNAPIIKTFRNCGLSHMFSVSGMHLTLMAGAAMIIFRRLTSNYRAAAAAGIPFVLFFMAFAGFSAPVTRAGIMMLLSLIATIIGREADSLNSLGFAALIICVFNPCAAADAGMLMSFSAAAGLSLFYPSVSKWIRGAVHFDPKSRWAFVLRPVIAVTASSIIATACTFPVAVLSFGQTSLVAPLANVLCVYPASAFMIFGAVASMLSGIPVLGGIVGIVLFLPTWICGRLTIVVAELIAKLPGAGIAVNYPFMDVILVMWLFMIVLYLVLFMNDRQRSMGVMLLAALCVQILIIGVSVYNVSRLARQTVSVYEADGGCMVSMESGGRCILLGAGGDGYHSYLANNSLYDENITDALAVVVPDDSDVFSRGVLDMIEQFRPERVFVSDDGSEYELIEQLCYDTDIDMYSVDNARFDAGGCGMSFECHTDSEGSIWIWGDCGTTVLICPEEGDCLLLPDEFRSPDVLVVLNSDIKNITAVNSAAVVICAEERMSAKERAVLEYRGMKNVYAVEDDGKISFERKGQAVSVRLQ